MKQTLPEQLRLAADLYKKPYRYQTGSMIHKFSSLETEDIETCLKNGWEILPPEPLTFPDPPEGKQWHNPQGLTANQVEVNDGWRLVLSDEPSSAADNQWASSTKTWHIWGKRDSGYPMKDYACTYRTRAPLPAPVPARVPLTAVDVPPLSCYRQTSDTERWGVFLGVNPSGAFMGDDDHVRWIDLMEKFEILRPTSSYWQPCSKPAE